MAFPARAEITGPTGRATLGLGITQIIGWGTTFLMPSVLGRPIREELGLASELVYAGITVLFAVSALASPAIGRWLDRNGARGMMALGSVATAGGLATLSFANGAAAYFACWAALGLAFAMTVGVPSSVALAQIAGRYARQAIALLAVIGGLASTVFWPVAGLLDAEFGWRDTLLVFAALHIVICLPIHLTVLPRGAPAPLVVGPGEIGGAGLPPEKRRVAYLLLSTALALGMFVFTGMVVHMIEMFRGLGHPPAQALAIAAMVGPAQVTVRLAEVFIGHRYSVMASAVGAAAVLPFGLAVGLAFGDTIVPALLCIAAYGVANGMKAVIRATLPLALFGRAELGRYMGRLALPQGIVSAVAPVILAAVLERWGAVGAFIAVLIASVLALAAMLALARAAR